LGKSAILALFLCFEALLQSIGERAQRFKISI
jgi:hypothetical protein